MNAATESARFTDLLREAVEKPGTIHAAYTAFHNFSLGNQILALMQCAEREITPGPLATFPAWKDRGRFVRKGEKALTLCMPITCKRKADDANGEPDATFTRFVFKPRWFVLSQTDGADFAPELPADWNLDRALATLDIERIEFASTNGNSQGYARARQIAISPIAALPHKTTFHELAHVVLGHTAEADQHDGEVTPRNLREAEAESVALLCCETLGLDGAEYARGYIQNWLSGDTIPEANARRIFKAADAILKAGRPAADESEAE
jgi:antirestriction protein ArdC